VIHFSVSTDPTISSSDIIIIDWCLVAGCVSFLIPDSDSSHLILLHPAADTLSHCYHNQTFCRNIHRTNNKTSSRTDAHLPHTHSASLSENDVTSHSCEQQKEMSTMSFDREEWIEKQDQLLKLEMDEEGETDLKWSKWSIGEMVGRKVAVSGLKYASSHFISHGCREVVFIIPFQPGRIVGKRQPARINVRDTLRVQDFVTIRRKEKPNATQFSETIKVSPAVVSRITNMEVAVRLKEDAESTYEMEELENVIIVKHVIDDTHHRRVKKALTDLQMGFCPDVSNSIRDLIFGPDDSGRSSRSRGRNQNSADFLSKWFSEMELREEATTGLDENRNKIIALSKAAAATGPPVYSGDELILPGPVEFFNPDLDQSQKEAVEFALKQKTLAIIHGPPGTGKTTTLCEVIMQMVLRYRMRVLVCGPSNVAIDNLLKKLVDMKRLRDDCMVRMGNPARVFDTDLMEYTLDGQLAKADHNNILSHLRYFLESEPNLNLKKRIAGRLRLEKRRMAKPLLEKANVVLATLASACPHETLLNTIIHMDIDKQDNAHKQKEADSKFFDVVIIDECGQSTEMATYIPLWLGRKAILAGDHLQLPPTVLSQQANAEGLGISLMQRLLESPDGQQLTRMLTVQYRMNKLIMNLVSGLLYDSKLLAHPKVENHLMAHLFPNMSRFDYPAIAYINTHGQMRGHEEKKVMTNSLSNDLEADIVTNYAKRMTKDHRVHLQNIGVITPYQDQIRVIQKKLSNTGMEKIEVNTVDGFQGREKEVILISFVRSNDRGQVGFLKEKRRINVAITRARRHVLFVGNFGTLRHDEFISSLFEGIQGDGLMRAASHFITAVA
jgi:predicted DNA helicase